MRASTDSTHDDLLIPYDAQCPHGNYYSDCQTCSGAKADFERGIYERADWPCLFPDCAKDQVPGGPCYGREQPCK